MNLELSSKVFKSCQAGHFLGGVKDLANKDYHSLRGIYDSSSDFKYMYETSPAHFVHKYYPEYKSEPPTKDMILGSVFHCFVLEPQNFDKEFYVTPKLDMRKTADKELKKELETIHFGKQAIDEEMYAQARNMASSCLGNKEVKDLFDLCTTEVAFFWKDPLTGMKLRCKVDAICPGNFFLELKSANSAKPLQFTRQALRMNYDLSLAKYSNGIQAVLGGELLPAYFIPVEKEPPYVTKVYPISRGNMFWETGHMKFLDALYKLDVGRRENKWPAYETVGEIEPPAWALKELGLDGSNGSDESGLDFEEEDEFS